jgi:hypothetical protein
MPENPFACVAPGGLSDEEKNHHRQHPGRNRDLYQKVYDHHRLRLGCAFNREIFGPVRRASLLHPLTTVPAFRRQAPGWLCNTDARESCQ